MEMEDLNQGLSKCIKERDIINAGKLLESFKNKSDFFRKIYENGLLSILAQFYKKERVNPQHH